VISRDDALKLITEKGQSPNIVKHLIAVAAAMGALAEHFGEDPKKWEMAGLLHDADYNIVPLSEHTVATVRWFKGQIDPDIEQAIRSHNVKNNGLQPKTRMDWALYSVDNLAGLIIASALVLPNKKLAELSASSVLKRFREPSFAKGADREEIKACQNLGLSVPEFVAIVLPAIKAIASQLEL
jgi:putative nucleotidyltransferase with HDIG domain